MNNRIFRALECLESFFDDMLPRLRQNLNSYVVGNQIIFNQFSEKCVFGITRRRKTDFNFFKTDFYQRFIKLNFFVKAHRNYQRLVAVSQIDTAPDRSFFGMFFCRPTEINFRRQKITFGIFFISLHLINPFAFILWQKKISHVPDCGKFNNLIYVSQAQAFERASKNFYCAIKIIFASSPIKLSIEQPKEISALGASLFKKVTISSASSQEKFPAEVVTLNKICFAPLKFSVA